MSFIIDNVKYSEEKSAPRVCEECGEGMWDGFVSPDWDTYCSEKCFFDENYTKEQYEEEFEKIDGYGYYTDWLGEPYEDWVLLVKEQILILIY